MSRFIVLEGLDGAGTTTQVARLTAGLEASGRPVLATHEPTDRSIGRILRRVLAGDPEAPVVTTLPWLFAADRADHLASVIEPALAGGTFVVSDRYLHSSLAYQSLTHGIDPVYALNRTFRVPDLTVFLQISVDAALERLEHREGPREIYERRDHLERIARAYDEVLDLLEGHGQPILRLDATRTPDDLAGEIFRRVLEVPPWHGSSS